jgi:integration host factor subunit alpha
LSPDAEDYSGMAGARMGNQMMGGKTITRMDLSEAVYQRVGLSRTESAELVEMVLDTICDQIVQGNTVKLSSFGSFVVREKGERIGRNPKTGEEVPITRRKVMVFKPSNVLKGAVLEGNKSKARGK